jgi:CrcB protein
MTGILGGFTTFSAFSLEAVTLYRTRRRRAWRRSMWRERQSLSIAALFAGLALSRSLAA